MIEVSLLFAKHTEKEKVNPNHVTVSITEAQGLKYIQKTKI